MVETFKDEETGRIYSKEGLFEGLRNHVKLNVDPSLRWNTDDKGPILDPAPYTAPDGTWDANRAASWIYANAYDKYIKEKCGQCAKFVRLAIEAGGIQTIGRPTWAWHYIKYLPKIGFKFQGTFAPEQITSPRIGDIAVYLKHGNQNDYGHICMWAGPCWCSDFKQRSVDVYSGSTKQIYLFRFE